MEVHVRGWKCSDPPVSLCYQPKRKTIQKNQSAQSKGMCYIEKCMEEQWEELRIKRKKEKEKITIGIVVPIQANGCVQIAMWVFGKIVIQKFYQ